MPKASVLQESFTAGEISPLVQGRVQQPRYKEGLATCLNYLPTLQGPLVRRPGSKYVTGVKDSTKPPVLIPFQFSITQAYMLEFGDKYVRFFVNGLPVTVGPSGCSSFSGGVNGGLMVSTAALYSVRPYFATFVPALNEYTVRGPTPTFLPSGNLLELPSPYAVADVSGLKWVQSADTVYLFHPNYPTYKLQRLGVNYWNLVQVDFLDGPYLPAYSYQVFGDNLGVTSLTPQNTTTPGYPVVFQAFPSYSISGCIADPAGSGQIQLTFGALSTLVTGQRVYVSGVGGTTEANNRDLMGGPTSGPTSWVITVTSQTSSPTTTVLLQGSTFVHAYTSGGTIAPGLFYQNVDAYINHTTPPDMGRNIGVEINGARVWGKIVSPNPSLSINPNVVLYNSCSAAADRVFVNLYPGTSNPGPTAGGKWYLGKYSYTTGFPSCGTFHQGRLVLAGSASSPQDIDATVTGDFESFAPSSPANLQASDSSAYNFSLTSQDVNTIRWLKSNTQGLLAGSYTAEWMLAPSTQNSVLTPSNVSASQTSTFGSANIDSVNVGNAVLYIQRAQRKLRELNYFWQAATFRSTDLTELSEHITLPTITKLAVQKETQPIVWAIRSDGTLLSMVYSRDDMNLRVGWARHTLGGQSDSGGTPPLVTSIATIPSTDLTFDQLWMIVKRYINGSTVYTIEYLTKMNDDSILQEDAFQLDCGATYDQPITITGITTANPAVVTAPAHGLSNGFQVRLVGVVGLNQSTTDSMGNTTITNLVNEKTFVVAAATTNTFQLDDFNSNQIVSTGYSGYVSGGQVRKMVTTISGLTWLENETVSVLADGAIHPNVTVSNSGSVTLNYPGAKAQMGYAFNSDGQLLRSEAGAADGTSIGKMKRVSRVAAMLHRVGDFLMGMSLTDLFPVKFTQADQQQADQATPLWSGLHRDGVESGYDFEQQFCFRQNSPLPGTIQAITTIVEENDV